MHHRLSFVYTLTHPLYILQQQEKFQRELRTMAISKSLLCLYIVAELMHAYISTPLHACTCRGHDVSTLINEEKSSFLTFIWSSWSSGPKIMYIPIFVPI